LTSNGFGAPQASTEAKTIIFQRNVAGVPGYQNLSLTSTVTKTKAKLDVERPFTAQVATFPEHHRISVPDHHRKLVIERLRCRSS